MSENTPKPQTNVVMTPMRGPTPQLMPMPNTLKAVNCPPGLEYLLQVDQLLVKQKIELLETLTGFETNNQYDIQNNLGQNVFMASEDTDCCTRNCCGPNRAFDMRIVGPSRQEVIHLYRPLRCDTCCCFCCLQYMRVESPPGQLIGHVVQDCSCLRPSFHIEDPSGKKTLRIEGPVCTFSIFCQDVEFHVFSNDKSARVGRITKRWSGILRETFTDADIYGVLFPMDMDVKTKVCLLAATFLIDYMFFEKKGNEERDRPGMMDSRF
ncbi:unnamed protein product [Medioppia subpectinata]|uniref:Phospholipid scramblase n=1 Tax=Medioppia subpectinata TaxID=1979941 RepID=A0A7R9PUT2_9ACAR|nr:unnamed protein product [Medioppia subpectinata]CAG2101876.1 unnamed protein product [Medioppia subpectinata]